MSEPTASAPSAPPGPTRVKDRRRMEGSGEDSDLLDPSTLQKGFAYRWVQERPANVVRRRNQGFTFVRREDGVRTMFDQDDNAADGLIRHGDRVLMKEPVAAKEARRVKNLKVSAARLKASDAAVKDLAARAGVKLSEGDEDL